MNNQQLKPLSFAEAPIDDVLQPSIEPIPFQLVENERKDNERLEPNEWTREKLKGATGVIREWYSIGDEENGEEGPLFTWSTPAGETLHEVAPEFGFMRIVLCYDENGQPGKIIPESE